MAPVLGKLRTIELIRSAQAVAFDVDSTVQEHEGIDKLAAHCGKFDEVQRLTKAAMQGQVLFQDALHDRLHIIQPSRAQVDMIARGPIHLVQGVAELISRLKQMGKQVFLISGGFRTMIAPIAQHLHIDDDHVFANSLIFDESGRYASFDESEPTSRSGGKRAALEIIEQRFGFSNIIMVGDGVTDLEARPPASAFVGFGGIAKRDIVKHASDWYVESFHEIVDAIQQE